MASHHARVDTSELKDMLYRRIGHKRSEKYFNQLQKFLALKLSKVEFNKSCLQTIGRENIPLHNKLIRSIVRNAYQSKSPPLKSRTLRAPHGRVVCESHPQPTKGDGFPHKSASPINRKLRDRSSPLGPLGKSFSLTCEETVTRLQEQQQSASQLHSLSSKPLLDDGEEVEQLDGGNNLQRWSHITAPHGVSVDKLNAIKFVTNTFCQSSRELPDSVSLYSHLKRKLETQGLEIDCANLLNASLDVYLKRLIEPCLNITRSRRLRDQCNKGERFANFVPQSNPSDRPRSSSLLDFRFAVESNSSVLGVDWPVQLEKIGQYSMQEGVSEHFA